MRFVTTISYLQQTSNKENGVRQIAKRSNIAPFITCIAGNSTIKP